ncbi:MAG: DUF5689 domain-containing protein [Saprospiraceae bacterium]
MFFKKSKPLASSLAAALFVATTFVACVKTDFDQPPTGGDGQDIPTNTTIQELKGYHETSGGFDLLTDDLVIGGTVVMDDRSGNYYKTIVIQDSTGGIEVKFSNGYLQNRYPVGRKIYIRCKGLMLTDYNGLIQLVGGRVVENGISSDIGLTENQERTQIVLGFKRDAPAPKIVSVSQLNEGLVSTLITLEDVEFTKADTAQTWADVPSLSSLNRTIQDCNGAQLFVRTSGFADFAIQKTPRGKGSITGVLGIFKTDYQLYIRDLNDVAMDSLRCGAVDPNAPALKSLNETFDGVTANVDVTLGGWQNIAVQGNRYWRGAAFSGDKFCQATAFSSGLANMETWMISPSLDLKVQRTLSFETSSGYWRHDGLTAWVSTNFDGQNVGAATWTQLNFTLPPQDPNGYSAFVGSGNIALPISQSKGYVAFKYVGNTSTNTTTWRFDDVKMQ